MTCKFRFMYSYFYVCVCVCVHREHTILLSKHIKLCVKCLVGSSTGLTSFYGRFYCLQLWGSFVSRTKAWKNRRLAHFRPRDSKSSLTVGWQQHWRKAKSFLKPRKVQKKNLSSCRSTAVLFSLIVFVDPGAIGRHAGIVNRSHFQRSIAYKAY